MLRKPLALGEPLSLLLSDCEQTAAIEPSSFAHTLLRTVKTLLVLQRALGTLGTYLGVVV